MRILVAQNVGRARNGGMSRIMGRIHDEIALAGHSIEYLNSEDVTPRTAGGPLSRFAFPAAVVRHARSLRAAGRGVDIINVHEPSGSVAVLCRSLLAGTKVVVTSHGVEQRSWTLRLATEATECEKPAFKTRLVHPATVLWQTRVALRKADHVFCLNEEDHQYVVRNFKRKSDDVTRIFPAADPVFGRSTYSREYQRCNRILFAGTWLQRKGTEYLANAFCRLLVKYPKIQLIVLNPGVQPKVVNEAFPPAVQPKVCCVFTRTDEETVEAFEQADLFVLPSLFEGTPLTLIEAMWSGLPIVTTSTCGMKDVIDHERTGLLVPVRCVDALENALSTLIRAEALRRSLGVAAAREASEKLRWQDSAGKVLAQYERLIAK